jgi:hypothetical protein
VDGGLPTSLSQSPTNVSLNTLVPCARTVLVLGLPRPQCESTHC